MSEEEQRVRIPEVLPARDLLIARTFQPELHDLLRVIVGRLEIIQSCVEASVRVVKLMGLILLVVVLIALDKTLGLAEFFRQFGWFALLLFPTAIFFCQDLFWLLVKLVCLKLYRDDATQAANEIMAMIDGFPPIRKPFVALYDIGFGFKRATWEMIDVAYRIHGQ